MNIALLRKIQRRILKEPRQFQMSSWFVGTNSDETKQITHEIPNCGTAACIAGWAISLDFFAKNKKKKRVMLSIAAKNCSVGRYSAGSILGLTTEQIERLFFSKNWPSPWRQAHEDFDKLPPEDRARIACERIDHFIKTNGEE